MTKLSIAIVLLAGLGVGTALAAEKGPTTKPTAAKIATSQPLKVDVTKREEIDAAIDHDVTAVGTVESARWTKSGKTLLIQFKDAPTDFRLTAYGKQKPELDKAFDGDIEKNIIGKKIEVAGKVRKYSGSVEAWKDVIEIPVTKASQIRVAEDAKK